MNLTAERETYHLYHVTYRAADAYAYRDTYYDTYNANKREHRATYWTNTREHKQLPV